MPGIRRLSPLLVNQIAAGEVIERPASVVKELVENAIDAGAARIAINVERGGRELVEVIDDGCGIPAEDLPLALAPHATSKITGEDDLDAIATLGFRGEALASITSVSRLTLISRPASQMSALKIEAQGERIGEPTPCGAPPGTTITVRNLFFNTPARRKFLRTPQTEYNHIAELVGRLAMSHPRLGFTLTHDGRETLRFEPNQSPRQRVLAVIGEELARELLEISDEQWRLAACGLRLEESPQAPSPNPQAPSPLTLWGLIGTPTIARATARYQHIFLNGRPIRDRTIAHALKEGYRGLLDPSKQPLAVIYIEIDPGQIDVNVHPTKAEVRFRDPQAAHGLVLTAVRRTLLGSDHAPRVVVKDATGALNGAGLLADASARDAAGFGGGVVPTPRSFVEQFKRLDPVQRGFTYREIQEAMEAHGDASLPHANGESSHAPDSRPLAPEARFARLLQVHQSYLVVEDAGGLSIIDQHALHERIMFEDLKARILKGNLESQRLLMPAVVEATPGQMEILESLRPLLERLGIEAEPIGPRSIAVHAFPSFLFERHVEPIEFMTDLLDRAGTESFGPEDEAALHEALDMMACKAAVKAGDSLTESELAELLRRREEIERGGRCPHGRPTTIRLSLRDLEKQFGRR